MAPTFMGVLAFGGDKTILKTVLDPSGQNGAAGRGFGYPPDLFGGEKSAPCLFSNEGESDE